jgi:4-hydroxy 2-oxovalerate aldolase
MIKPLIMDCTLRDGSYAINFKFNQKDTSVITKKLSRAKIPLIEVGHGIGLGASKKGLGNSACSDEEYCIAASESIEGESKWGMFCIPGISSIEDLKIASSYGIDFIRIGTDVLNIKSSRKFIEFAKSEGIQVFSNFMKSDKADPKTFAKYAKESLNYGSDVIYIVDSCGGMFPNDLKKYISETFDKNPSIELGFHGHDNLGVGMANCLLSLQEGVKYIDSTLQGLGRSSGNVCTEHLICVLEKKGILKEIEPIEVMNIGEKYIRPLISSTGISSLDITLGWTLTHSSYMPMILSYSKQNKIDPRKLLKYLADNRIKNFETNNINNIIEEIKKSMTLNIDLDNWPDYFGEEEQWKN